MRTRRGRRTVGMLLVVASLTAAAPSAASRRPLETEQLPNLVPLPAYDLSIPAARDGNRLLFAVATANRGEHPLDLEFRNGDPVEGSAEAHQCVAWATDRVCSARVGAGRFEWHAEHGHHHFEDFARYEIRRFRRPGLPDMRPRGLVATSGKVSFCLIDVEADRPADGPLYLLPYPLYYSCVAGSGFQGISPGWRDVYGRGTPGQEFPLEEIPDGLYALVVTSDPAQRLHETDETDNLSSVGFELSDHGAEVEVVCASEPGRLRCSGAPQGD